MLACEACCDARCLLRACRRGLTWPCSWRRVLVMSTGKVTASAAIDEVPVRQNLVSRPFQPEPVSAPPPIAAAGMAKEDVQSD